MLIVFGLSFLKFRVPYLDWKYSTLIVPTRNTIIVYYVPTTFESICPSEYSIELKITSKIFFFGGMKNSILKLNLIKRGGHSIYFSVQELKSYGICRIMKSKKLGIIAQVWKKILFKTFYIESVIKKIS